LAEPLAEPPQSQVALFGVLLGRRQVVDRPPAVAAGTLLAEAADMLLEVAADMLLAAAVDKSLALSAGTPLALAADIPLEVAGMRRAAGRAPPWIHRRRAAARTCLIDIYRM